MRATCWFTRRQPARTAPRRRAPGVARLVGHASTVLARRPVAAGTLRRNSRRREAPRPLTPPTTLAESRFAFARRRVGDLRSSSGCHPCCSQRADRGDRGNEGTRMAWERVRIAGREYGSPGAAPLRVRPSAEGSETIRRGWERASGVWERIRVAASEHRTSSTLF